MGGSLGLIAWAEGRGAEAEVRGSLTVCAGDLCGRLVVAVVHQQTFDQHHQFKYSDVLSKGCPRTASSWVGWALHFEALEDLSSKTLSEEFDPGSE